MNGEDDDPLSTAQGIIYGALAGALIWSLVVLGSWAMLNSEEDFIDLPDTVNVVPTPRPTSHLLYPGSLTDMEHGK